MKILAGVIALTLLLAGGLQAAETVKLKVEGLHCQGCVDTVEKGLKKVKGVTKADVDLKSNTATVTYDEKKVAVSTVANAVEKNTTSYTGKLTLTVKAGKDKSSVEKARKAVAALPEVEKATLEKNTLVIAFKPKADPVSLTEIKVTIKKAGASA